MCSGNLCDVQILHCECPKHNLLWSHLIQISSQKRKIKQGKDRKMSKKRKDGMLEQNEDEVVEKRFVFLLLCFCRDIQYVKKKKKLQLSFCLF